MNRRSLKILALITGGGLLLQTGGCGTLITQLVVQQVVSTILTSLLGAATAATAA